MPLACTLAGALFVSACAAEEPAVAELAPPSLFDTSRLHHVEIEVEPQYLEALAENTSERVPATFTFDGTTLTGVGIRRKGGAGSLRALDEKPAFSLKLDEFQSKQELDGLDKLLLNNAVQDPSFLNEHLGYEVFRRAGIPAPRTSHAVVTFNGEVFGLYVVREPTDREFLRRHFGEHDDGNLYEGCCLDDFVTQPWLPELKNEVEEGRSRADLEAFAEFIANEPDATFAEKLPEWLDVDSFLTSWAVEAVTGHADGFVFNLNNYFFYNHPADGRFLFLPHGMDRLFEDFCFDPLKKPASRLSKRILAVPQFAEQLRMELARVAGEPSDPAALAQRIAAVRDALAGARTIGVGALAEDVESFDGHAERTLEGLEFRRRMVAGLAEQRCGNGLTEGTELCGCDDGNTVPGDGCNASCQVEFCGDEVVNGAEVCDGPGCNLTCTGPAVCGDGLHDPGEECDDGNDAPGDGCDACRLGCMRDSIDGTTYAFCLSKVTASDARKACRAEGGELVTPENEAENRWLSERADDAGANDFWLGPTDEDEEGVWRTESGEAVGYLPWGPKSPNGDTHQNCAISETWYDGAWNDQPCKEHYAFVCRIR